MSNVLIDKDKLDVLANAIANKSGESLTLTLDEMVSAVDGIETGGGGITPTGNIDITSAGTTDVTNYATATVASATGVQSNIYSDQATMWVDNNGVVHSFFEIYDEPIDIVSAGWVDNVSGEIPNSSANVEVIGELQLTTRTSSDLSASGATVTAPSGYYASNASYSIPYANFGVPSNERTKENGKFIYTRSFPQFTSGYLASASPVVLEETLEDKTVTPSTSQQVITPTGSNYYLNSVTVDAMPSGTEGTPTATKGTVSNHSISVTPSVTNSVGYISGGTHNGTAVTVSASELVSGSQTVTENDTYDVTNLATLVVNVSGGGSTVAVGTKTTTLSASASSISFTGLSGNPTSFVVTSSADQSTGGTKAVAVAYDGTNLYGMDVTTQAENDTGFTKSYSSGTLTITATTATFEANEYKLVYTYGGSSSDIHTVDVQVGSGATSITFSSLSGRPIYISSVFKSSFSTSSGYQRVIDVVNDGTNTYGHAFDSSAKAQTSWTYSYSGGSLTITSSGTNNGGYFHQPGYYQLTYAVDDSAPTYQTKSAYATTSAQTITADNGYDALEQVNLGALSQTNLTAGNIKSGTTVTINNGSANVWSVLGTYTGGGSTDHLTKIATKSLGTISTSSTSATDTGQTLDVSGFDAYDMLIAICHTTTHTNGRHVATVRLINFSATSSTATKTATSIATSTQHYKLSSSGTLSERSGTTPYGVYVNGATINTTTPRTLTLTIYQRYNSTSTGTINGSYTLDVYGVNLQDLF